MNLFCLKFMQHIPSSSVIMRPPLLERMLIGSDRLVYCQCLFRSKLSSCESMIMWIIFFLTKMTRELSFA
uniref:Uncharacterized protein n=1 Tax=Anguilla anguilla TaxID=7936 RepID=A0A0E9RZY9_ANGAN